MRPPDFAHFRSLLAAAHTELAHVRRVRECAAANFSDTLRRESDWLRAAQANLRQFIWDRPGSDASAKRRSV